jgi:gamma-glutamylcyclotransferase
MLKYFAYGSNLHPVRLIQRVPESEFVSSAMVSGYCLRFHKRSSDGSGKCNIVYSGSDNDIVYGAIYLMPVDSRKILDRYEGVGDGYEIQMLEVQAGNQLHEVFAYLAQKSHIDDLMQPYHWYKELVLRGAELHMLPDHYIRSISAVASVQDEEQQRRLENETLLDAISAY